MARKHVLRWSVVKTVWSVIMITMLKTVFIGAVVMQEVTRFIW